MALADPKYRHKARDNIVGVATFVMIIWAVFVLDRFLPLEQLGLVPRTTRGLLGIVAMPFLHSNWGHLVGNSVPLVVTLLLLAGSRAHSGAIVTMITLLAGIALWLFGRSALHIGASGLVFGLIAFHIAMGFFERNPKSLIIAAVVGVLYASTLLRGVLPLQQGVSWEGHLFGALAGILVALLTARVMRDAVAAESESRPA